jgi:hypothetical protein
MIRDGELDRILSSTKFLNKIHSGGHIKSMMENFGT